MNEQAAAFQAWANSYSQDRVYEGSAEAAEPQPPNGEEPDTPEYLTTSVSAPPPERTP